MNTTHFVNPHGVTIFRTRMTVKGEDVLVSTSGNLGDGEPVEPYWETAVFYPGQDGEPDFDRGSITEERHYLNDLEAIFGLSKYGVTDDFAKMEKIHQAIVATLVLLDRGVVFGHANDIRDVVYAVSYNDYGELK